MKELIKASEERDKIGMNNEVTNECIERLKILNFNKNIIQDFVNDNVVYVSDIANDSLDIADNSKILEVEKNKSIKIYHIIKINENSMYFLHVNLKNIADWKKEQSDLKNGFAEILCCDFLKKIIGIEVCNKRIKRVV